MMFAELHGQLVVIFTIINENRLTIGRKNDRKVLAIAQMQFAMLLYASLRVPAISTRRANVKVFSHLIVVLIAQHEFALTQLHEFA